MTLSYLTLLSLSFSVCKAINNDSYLTNLLQRNQMTYVNPWEGARSSPRVSQHWRLFISLPRHGGIAMRPFLPFCAFLFIWLSAESAMTFLWNSNESVFFPKLTMSLTHHSTTPRHFIPFSNLLKILFWWDFICVIEHILLKELFFVSLQFHCSVAQSCRTLCNPIDCCLPGSSVCGILQARILEWVAISSSRGSSQPLTTYGCQAFAVC